jgi:hypothetical protein
MPTPCLPPSRIYQNAVLDSTRWQAFIPRADDIVISTSYKAGTTWTMAIVRELVVHAMQQAGITEPNSPPRTMAPASGPIVAFAMARRMNRTPSWRPNRIAAFSKVIWPWMACRSMPRSNI